MTVIDAYEVSLIASKQKQEQLQTKLETVQHEAAISKQKCAGLEDKIIEMEDKVIEMEKKIAVLHDNNEQQADKLETLQRKGIHETIQLLLFCLSNMQN